MRPAGTDRSRQLECATLAILDGLDHGATPLIGDERAMTSLFSLTAVRSVVGFSRLEDERVRRAERRYCSVIMSGHSSDPLFWAAEANSART
jgi:hypothetical protein